MEEESRFEEVSSKAGSVAALRRTIAAFLSQITKKLRNGAHSLYGDAVSAAVLFREAVGVRLGEAKRLEAEKGGRYNENILILRVLLFWLYDGLVDAMKALGFVRTALFAGGLVAFFLVCRMGLELYDNYVDYSSYGDYSLEYPRPPYYRRGNELRIRNIVVPVYVDSVNSYKKLELDLSVITGNKYIKEYLDAHSHLVLNILSSHMEPIDSEFLLTVEGKRVMADKIKQELNALIGRLRIEGQVEEVYIHYMFAG